LGEIWFQSSLWCCELIFIVGLRWRPFWIQNCRQNTKILRFGRNCVMKGIQKNYKSPFVCFHGNCGKVCPTDPDFFGLSRSTRFGCCSYQVSSSP
jgi:hypothetical protein